MIEMKLAPPPFPLGHSLSLAPASEEASQQNSWRAIRIFTTS